MLQAVYSCMEGIFWRAKPSPAEEEPQNLRVPQCNRQTCLSGTWQSQDSLSASFMTGTLTKVEQGNVDGVETNASVE